MSEDSLLERVATAAEERDLFAEFPHGIPAHLG